MSKFIANHPSAIEVWLFYKRKEGKGGLYEKLCKVIGENGIFEEEFNKLFDKMTMEDEESKRKEIRQFVVNNQANLRICILSDVIEKKSIIESFLSITKMIGTHDITEMMESNVIDYQDFEFWFNRFSSGNWNLDQKSFFELPLLIVSNIVEKSDFRSQMRLRKVSHGLRNIVDQVKPSIDKLIYEFDYDDSQSSAYFGYCTSDEKENGFRYTGKNYLERVFKDMMIHLNNRRLRLKCFEWANYLTSDVATKFIKRWNSLNHKIEIVSLDVYFDVPLMIDLLKAVKPGTLEHFVFPWDLEQPILKGYLN
uniref:F-box domain-containing protein n=1 Tax=Caenorhabditis tropicalis TaxID=1561998 RepID=A0A1I7UI91_9PELO